MTFLFVGATHGVDQDFLNPLTAMGFALPNIR
ncbi:hypothetical protein H4W80_004272 [Nonomuraea angiospora]|uniref:Uncharacterized protein n=1 Tax=Nonomuraea angiospora TaxID=46172 RepID=A0ABR9LZE6_9ACTN|nr:hypothetical protein [Nonomuraea angiospora]